MIRAVRAFPPNDSWSIRVSLELRYGTCVAVESVRALMTLPAGEKN